MTFHQCTTGEEVAKACIARSEGKTFVITGTSTGGIGAATAIALAHSRPKTLFLASRSLSKTEPVIQEIKSIGPSINVIFVELDLSDLESVRKAAKGMINREEGQKIDYLINNAGVMCTMPYTKTKQGIELQFGTNHVGHFLWTNLLLPRVLAAGGNARIVNVASTGYVLSEARLDDVNWDHGKSYHPWLAYGSSKTANVLFNTYLASHLKSKGVDCFALQPGMPQTPLYVHTQGDGPAAFPEALKILEKKYNGQPPPSGLMEEDEKTVEQAASTLVAAALDPRFDGKFELFLRNCQPFDTVAYTTDPESAEKLWKLSEKLVGQGFKI
ncbi:related to retinol dehydrogenase 12 [Phialocephala subalpina]|uniref:Related to retinol dehydrogenase 12 n=1 Tax=Phialocephala subalpina TaxID=576137 RepID=A0A1L7WGP0_9HELO|nr:related to retinol dehydrogenase 12 [Phialocephala subalpina]